MNLAPAAPSPWLITLFSTVIILGVALVMLARTDGHNRATIINVAFGGSVGIPYAIGSMLISYDAPNFAAIHPQFWQLLLALISMGAYGRLVAVALPISPRSAVDVAPSDISLEPGRRVAWFGRATSSWRLWGGLVLIATSVGVAVFNPSASIAVLMVAALLFWRSRVKVRIDDGGVTVVDGPANWPRFTVSLNQITGARTLHLDSLNFRLKEQGIGKEGGDARSRLITTGCVLVIETRNHLPIYLSLEHADEAAEVTNALITRTQRTGSQHV